MKEFRRTAGAALVLASTFGLVACGGAAGEESLGETQQAVYDYDEGAGVFVPGTEPASLRANVVVSLWRRGKWNTEGARNDGDGCSGILITPKLVLTASSCTRKLGTSELDVYVGSSTPDVAGIGIWKKFESESLHRWGAAESEPSLRGFDLLVVRLKTPVLEEAQIHRPPLTAPSPLTAIDAEGWAPYAAGISGWSPFTMIPGLTVTDARTTRQTFFKATAGDDELRLNRVTTTSRGGLWIATTLKPVTNLPKLGLAPGDNGGPLFVRGPNGRLDVIGIASVIGTPPDPALSPTYDVTEVPSHILAACMTPEGAPVPASEAPNQCNGWTNVTSASALRFISGAVRDLRTPRWNAMHPRVGEGQSGSPWFGEVDYTGPCTTSTDPDCDHTYTYNANLTLRDNCGGMTNVDQVDTADANMGDVCTTACAAQSCTAANSCATLNPGTPQCGVVISFAVSPSSSYGNSACFRQYTAMLDQSTVRSSGSVQLEIGWGDTPLTQATCPNARLELTVFRKSSTGVLSTTAHRYTGVWQGSCSFALESGYSSPAPVLRSANETVKVAGSARLHVGSLSLFKKVMLVAKSDPGPC